MAESPAATDVTRLVLIRHGESQATVDGVVAGERGCTGLSDLGRRQAEALRDRLAATGELAADVLVASTLPRAIETAELIAPALGVGEIVQVHELCELQPGECDAMTWEEYDQRYGVDMKANPYTPIAPGGESMAEFNVRVGTALAVLTEQHAGRSVVVACHGGVVVASMVSFLGLPAHRPLVVEMPVTNTSITEWERRAGAGAYVSPPWRLLRYNDAAHLAGVSRKP
ncbi:MAG: histidine phosphatase family protein [Actinomycetota bacterium]|nr:histidine phosphatase family protein [Actinomycetota bacterium]